MATIKFTDTVWLAQETEKVLGVLQSERALGGRDGKDGKPVSELRALLNYAGLDYETVDMIAIRDELVAQGIIEVVP